MLKSMIENVDLFKDEFLESCQESTSNLPIWYKDNEINLPTWYKDNEGNLNVWCEMLGISEDSIEISINGSCLKIVGSEVDDLLGREFKQNYDFTISPETIESIEYTCKNGILYLKLTKKQPVKQNIPIVRFSKN